MGKVIIVTGEKGEGKTTFLQKIVDTLKSENISVSGFTAPASIINGRRNTYSIMDIETGKLKKLCSREKSPGFIQIGSFWFDPMVINYGNTILEKAKNVIIIDEIGPMELEGKVWHKGLTKLLKSKYHIIILSIRISLIKDVLNHYSLKNCSIFSVNDNVNNIINELKV